jgi:hypothetical protein
LEFTPPGSLSAVEPAHHPYFYRGFLLQQAALALSIPRGAIFATRRSCLVLRHDPFRVVELRGILPPGTDRLEARVSCNGQLLGAITLRGPTWCVAVPVDPDVDILALPAPRPALKDWFELSLDVALPEPVRGTCVPDQWPEDALFGLAEVRLLSEPSAPAGGATVPEPVAHTLPAREAP